VKQELYRFPVGERPHTVTVVERKPGGVLYMRMRDPTTNRYRYRSTETRDKRKAKAMAHREHVNLVEGLSNIAQGKVTYAQVFALYLEHQTPRKKSEGERKADKRRADMFTLQFGGTADPHVIAVRDWRRFIDARLSGEIDARGEPQAEPKPVRARTVEADCKWLRWVFNWAAKWRTPAGHYLMRENPIRGFELPREENPRREVATHNRYEAVLAVADQIGEDFRDLLDLVHETGRRITPVCTLRYSDLRLNDGTPHGSIVWPAQTDKMTRRRDAMLSPSARAAINRVPARRPGIGDAYLFPHPRRGGEAITRYIARTWMVRAEKLAELEPLDGTLWHAYRRKWVTERKYLPDPDVARMGGWKSIEAMKMAYQHADPETSYRVLSEPRRLREAK
jgi:integrase